jgi:hypothetical protein
VLCESYKIIKITTKNIILFYYFLLILLSCNFNNFVTVTVQGSDCLNMMQQQHWNM